MKNLGIYLHIPFCQSKCIYCDFASGVYSPKVVSNYVDKLIYEINSFDIDRTKHNVDTIYFGGGTPSILPNQSFELICQCIRNKLHCDIQEFTVEVNPNTVDNAKLDCYKSCGVTRISFGVQSLNDNILSLIGRKHTAQQAVVAVQMAVKKGFDVSVDMMLGLPQQDMQDVKYFIDNLSDIAVHISCYGLKVEKNTKLFELINRNELQLPSDDLSVDMYEYASQLLLDKGYARYEVSNFAKQGKQSLHNLKYWRCEPYLGFGLSAHSFFGNKRFYNTSDINQYLNSGSNHKYLIEEQLTNIDLFNEYVMLGLRLNEGINTRLIFDNTQIDFFEVHAQYLKKHAEYFDIQGEIVKLKDKYIYIMNSILSDLL